MKLSASAPSENIAVAGSCGSKVLRGGDSQRTNREALGFFRRASLGWEISTG
jgi:hypothetical protein